MNEGTKTAIFAGIAVLVGCVWLIARPKEKPGVEIEKSGRVLFDKLDDPTQAATLEILRYNEELGEIHEFKVAKNGKTGLWSIPSHSEYPADAENRIRDVATSLVGLQVLGVVTADKAEHELFGVTSPTRIRRNSATRAWLAGQLRRSKGKEACQFDHRQTHQGAEGHHFVREPGREFGI